MAAPAWLTARPIAHRGLHDAAAGRIENTLSAIEAAAARGFAIEIDLQRSADGEAMVFHDETLERLTSGHGPVDALPAADLTAIAFTATADRMPRFTEVLALVAGRVPLIVEIKSRWRRTHDRPLVARAAEVARGYDGPLAFMSFDPGIVTSLRVLAPDRPRGIIAERTADDRHWGQLSRLERASLQNLLHWPRSCPQFIAYGVKSLPAPAPALARRLGVPVLTWTVRTADDVVRAKASADQIIFEGFDPEAA